MTSIRVAIIDQTGGTKTVVEAPDDVPMRELIPALVESLRMPKATEDGNPITYKLKRLTTDGYIDQQETLASAGVQSNEVVSLTYEIMTGKSTINQPNSNIFELKKLIDVSAPVFIPDEDNLAVNLVQADIVYRLEEYRSDEQKWESIMWTFIGATLGIVVNWVTSDPIVITRISFVLVTILLLMVVITFIATREYKRRADVMKARLFGQKIRKI